MIRLWSFQEARAAQTLANGAPYRTDAALAIADPLGLLCDDDGRYTHAYDWIARQLADRDPSPEGVRWPVWAWYLPPDVRWTSSGRPDLRRHRPLGPGVMLHLLVERSRVLLSDFDEWHSALNTCFLGPGERQFDRDCAAAGVDSANPHQTLMAHPDLVARLEASWRGCLRKQPRRHAQAVLWEIRPGDLTGVTTYHGRPIPGKRRSG